MKIYPLQTAILSNPVVEIPELMRFRAQPRSDWHVSRRKGILSASALTNDVRTLEFSTFFGAFSLNTWCGPAGLDTVLVKFKARGKAILRVWKDTGYLPRTILWEDEIAGQEEPSMI